MNTSKTNYPELNIIVMARERPIETSRAIRAISKIDFGCDVNIIVSDNPSTPEKALSNLPKEIKHKIRVPSGDTYWHFKTIISESKTGWILITHDDDELLPELGEYFKEYSWDPTVSVITGRSNIVRSDGRRIHSKSYEKRLRKSGLLSRSSIAHTDLELKLFRFGSLFPASAIIVRSEVLIKMLEMNIEVGLAYDMAYSMRVSKGSIVMFQGDTAIMNYYLHGGNSVFSEEAIGGLHADLAICRLDAINSGLLNPSFRDYLGLMTRVFKARLISSAFNNKDKVKVLDKYVNAALNSRPNNLVLLISSFSLDFPFTNFFIRKLLTWKVGKSL